MTLLLDGTATTMPIGRYEWERLVRRIVMPAQHKLVALVLATYADPDGTRVRPGMDLLGAVIGRTERTAAGVVRSLCREWGLLELVARGGGRNGKGKTADYRLTIPTDLLDRHVLLSPDGRPDSPEVQISGHSTVSPEAMSSGQSDPPPVDNPESPEIQASRQSETADGMTGKFRGVTNGMTGNFQGMTGNPALPTTTHVTKPPKDDQPGCHLPTQPPERASPVGEPDPSRLTLDEALPLARPQPPPSGPKCAVHPLMTGGTDPATGQPRCPLCRRGFPADPPETT